MYYINNKVEKRIRRLSRNQLKILSFLANSSGGAVSSVVVGKKLGLVGKPLGGVFSSLSRQEILGQSLIIPFGRGSEGRGLRWKLNEDLISVKELEVLVEEILKYW